jgi:2-polyprenyl-3-methyl-5-hydroxy-6-metoxy-1,4-benzoquinol methylase
VIEWWGKMSAKEELDIGAATGAFSVALAHKGKLIMNIIIKEDKQIVA